MTQTMQAAGHLDPEQVNAFVDGELSSSEAREVQQHLADCHRCALRVLSATQLKAATARAGQRFSAPPEALTRLAMQLRPQAAKKAARVYSMRVVWWGALAACLLIAVSLIGWRQTRRANALSAELLDQHLATLSSGATPEVISTDRHTVKPWFQGRIPFTFNLPELPGSEFSLVGGRVAYLEQTPGAHLIFQIRKHEISVFIFSEREMETRTLPSGPATALSFNMETWTKNGLRYFVIGDAGAGDIRALSKLLQDAS